MNPQLVRFLKMQILVFLGAIAVGAFTVTGINLVNNLTGAAAATALTQSGDTAMIGVGAGLAVGLAGLGSGIGMGTAGAAAIGAITEKPEVFGKSLIYVVLIEAVAIYGLVIAFLLIQQLT